MMKKVAKLGNQQDVKKLAAQCAIHSVSGSTLTTVTKRKLKPYEFVCDDCGKLETMSAYCVAQITMGYAVTYTCDVCGHKTVLEGF